MEQLEFKEQSILATHLSFHFHMQLHVFTSLCPAKPNSTVILPCYPRLHTDTHTLYSSSTEFTLHNI